jgi:leucine dehydrogenase
MSDESDVYEVFSELSRRDHEQVVFCRDEVSGLRAIVAIHNTVLGPALGGVRMFPYKSEKDALIDALRLSRGMTYKAAVSGLNLGGGKAVVIGDPKKDKSELLWRAFGRFLEGLGGRYITAEDAGTTMQDMEYIRMETSWVVGISRSLGGSGDPSPVTALGVFSGMRAAVEEKLNRSTLNGLKVAVQGCGHVGNNLVGHLVRAGAKVTVADIDAEAVKRTVAEYQVEAVAPDSIYDVPCDIFAPCAMGGILNEKTIPRLKCGIIAGAANNQLANEKEDASSLMEKRILYSPDFVINAGGLINVANELEGYNQERALTQAKGIYAILKDIFERARRDSVPTFRAANNLAMDRLESLGRIRRTFTGYGGGGGQYVRGVT